MSRHQSHTGRLRIRTSNPTTPKEGEEFFNNEVGKRVRYDGSKWVSADYTSTSTSTTTSTSTSTSTSTTTS